MPKKIEREPVEITDETPVVFVLRDGRRITATLREWGKLKIESERRMRITPSDAHTVYVE